MKILDDLKRLCDTRGEEIENWLSHQRDVSPPYVYTSVDLRHSGIRLAPVDVNLFPAGFNNLSPAAAKRVVEHFKKYFAKNYLAAKRLLIVAESHTRNLAYLQNLHVLQSLLAETGMEVRLSSLMVEKGKPLVLTTSSGATITEYALVKNGNELQTDDGFKPDVVLLNNDLTSGMPEILAQVAQPVIPPPQMGWYRRRKSVHFRAYKHIADAFCKVFSLDPWLIAADYHACGMIDFKERAGIDCVAENIEEMLVRTRDKYKEYGIDQEPYIFVKADSGTYGMGIMTVKSSKDIFDMNKKERNKMYKVKEGKLVSEVIIQEGIPTVDVVNGSPAEPMVYLVGGCPTGGMYRVNASRDAFNNLNASGMEFTGMCDQVEQLAGSQSVKDCDFRSFGLIASLSALAAAREEVHDASNTGEKIYVHS